MPRTAGRVFRGYKPAIKQDNDTSQLSGVITEGKNTMADETKTVERKVTLVTKKGKTRGKNPRDIEYQAFDLEQPNTLPTTQAEFMEATGLNKQEDIVSLLVDGFNLQAYSAASDEIGEYINDEWDKETQNQFRLAVRNMSKLTNQSIEDTVTMLKPGVEKGFAEKKAKAAAEKASEKAA
jgi:hypothetical protein